ncbi:MAG: VOC family protein [Bacteroidota bacterium]|nr:VOC family protein [Bacteroidota bacterium]
METVSPNIFVNDLQATIEYYQKLDFQIVTSVPDESGKMIFVLMMNGTTTFMFQTFKSIENQLSSVSRSNGGSLLLYIKMKGIRNFFEKIKEKVNILSGLEKTFYGATEFSVIDPNNFMLTFAEDE